MMSTEVSPSGTGTAAGASGGSNIYPDLTSPTDSVIAGDFGQMSAEEQEKQREEWKAELAKTEEEILTLKQVLNSKEAHASGLKRRLGITAWREFSEDMTHGLKNIQESEVYKKTGEAMAVARERTAGLWTSVTSSTSFQSVSGKVGSAFGAAKSKISGSMSQQNVAGGAATPAQGADASNPSTQPAASNGQEQQPEAKK